MSSDYDKQQWQAEQAAHDAVMDKQREKERKTRERAARNAQRKLERLHRKLTETGEITEFENEFGESVLERLDKFGSAFHDLEKGRPGDALSFAQKSVVAAMNKKVKALKASSAKARISSPTSSPASSPMSSGDKTEDTGEDDFDDGYTRTADRWKNQKTPQKRSGFGSKKSPKFTPRVRHIEDDILDDTANGENETDKQPALYDKLAPELKDRVPYLPEYFSKQSSPPHQSQIAPQIPPQMPPLAVPATATPKEAQDAPKPFAKKPFLRLVK